MKVSDKINTRLVVTKEFRFSYKYSNKKMVVPTLIPKVEEDGSNFLNEFGSHADTYGSKRCDELLKPLKMEDDAYKLITGIGGQLDAQEALLYEFKNNSFPVGFFSDKDVITRFDVLFNVKYAPTVRRWFLDDVKIKPDPLLDSNQNVLLQKLVEKMKEIALAKGQAAVEDGSALKKPEALVEDIKTEITAAVK